MALKNGAYSLEEKREAVVYFNNNGVPKQIEQLLNKIFKEKPSDIFGYMVRYMVNFMLFSSMTSTPWCLYTHCTGEIWKFFSILSVRLTTHTKPDRLTKKPFSKTLFKMDKFGKHRQTADE